VHGPIFSSALLILPSFVPFVGDVSYERTCQVIYPAAASPTALLFGRGAKKFFFFLPFLPWFLIRWLLIGCCVRRSCQPSKTIQGCRDSMRWNHFFTLIAPENTYKKPVKSSENRAKLSRNTCRSQLKPRNYSSDQKIHRHGQWSQNRTEKLETAKYMFRFSLRGRLEKIPNASKIIMFF